MTASQESTAPPLPNGWFAIAWSKDLVPGDVKRIQYFGEELVLFRTREGVPKVLDAYCAHLGAHLAEGGRVVGETIRCPFHGWQYDGDGNCAKIPYCERIPAAAKLRSWEVVERNHMIMVWRHAENKPPTWEVPSMPEFDDAEWAEVRTFDLEVAVHMQDMAENNCDPIHFYYVHSATEQSAESEMTYGEGGRFFRITSTGEKETPFGKVKMELERDTWGLGVSSVRMKGIANAGLLMFSSTTPIDEGHSHSRWVFSVTKNLADIAGEEFIEGMSTGVLQDMRIWENKIHRADPVFCEADKYLAEFRRWTKQFYSNVE